MHLVNRFALVPSVTLIYAICVLSTLKAGVDVLTTCVGVTSSLTAAEVTILTNAWAELLTPASVNNYTVSFCADSTYSSITYVSYCTFSKRMKFGGE